MRILSDQKFEINHAFEVVHDDDMVSWFRSAVTKPGAPGYDTNRYFLWCTFSVLAPYRRRGIARSHLPVLLELMDRDGCRTVTMESEEESGHAFMRWLGAEKKLEGAENRLHIPDVDWAMMQRWIDEGAKGSPETNLEVYDDHIPDALLEEFAPQLSALLNTMPWDDLDHGDIVETPEFLRHEYERMDLAGQRHHTVLTREPNGVISGITDMNWAPHRPKILEQMFTGVRPDSRGRGIGKWIKATCSTACTGSTPTRSGSRPGTPTPTGRCWRSTRGWASSGTAGAPSIRSAATSWPSGWRFWSKRSVRAARFARAASRR